MNQRNLPFGILVSDLLCSVVAFAAALVMRYGIEWSRNKTYAAAFLPFLAVTWIVWTIFSLRLPLDGFQGGWRFSAVVSQLLLSVGWLMLILLSCGYLVREYVSRLVLTQYCLLLLVGFVLVRLVAYILLRAHSRNGRNRRVVIVGRGRLARELARKIDRHPEMLCTVVGFLAVDDGSSDFESSRPRAGSLVDTGTLGVLELLSQQRTDEVIFALEHRATSDAINLASRCRDRGIKVSLVPQFYDLYLSRSHLTDLDGLPVIQLAEPGMSVLALTGKRLMDLAVATLLTVPAVPILLPIVVALFCVKGKAFRWEMRRGHHGKSFSMLRLNVDRTASNGSRFEGFLRRFSLTELPQLWNVLRGNMSLVGPRPESPDRVCRYSEWQQQRLTIKPGMTGLAQVEGLREQHSSEEKTRFDLQYLLNPTPWTDLSILLQTAWTLTTRSSNRVAPSLEVSGSADAIADPTLQSKILEHAHRP